MENKFYIIACDPVFAWKQLIRYPLKWMIKLIQLIMCLCTFGLIKPRNKNWEIAHIAGYVNCGDLKDNIFQSTGDGFQLYPYQDFFDKRYSKIYAYKFLGKIDFEKTESLIKKHIGDKYKVSNAMYSALNNIVILNNFLKKVFNIIENDTFDYCDDVIVEILRENNYLSDIKESSLTPSELIDELQRKNLIGCKIYIWDKKKMMINENFFK